MVYGLLALAAITPVLYMPGSGGFEALKSAFFLLIASLILCGTAVTLIRQNPPLNRALILSISMIITYIVIRTLFVSAPNSGWLGTETSNWGATHWILLWLMLGIILHHPFTKKDRQLVLASLSIGLVGIILVILAQQTGLENITWRLFDDPSRDRNLIGSIGSSGQLGLMMALMAVIIWPLQRNLKTISRPAWLIFLLLHIVSAVIVFHTKSYSGIIVLSFGYVLHLLSATKLLGRRSWMAIFTITLVLPITAALLPIPRFITAKTPSFAARMNTWKTASRGIADAPLFGAGIEQFSFIYDRFNQTTPTNPTIVSEEHPHSLIIELLAEWGIIGVLLVTWFVVTLLGHTKVAAVHLPGLAAWLLAAQTNVGTVLLFVLLLCLCAISFRPKKITPYQSPRWLTWSALVASIPLALATVIVGLGGIVYARTNDAAVRLSANYLFLFAAQEYKTALAWPFTRSYSQLEYAEALTNNALKYDNFTHSNDVLQAVTRALHGSPTTRNVQISQKILSVWREHGTELELKMVGSE